MPLDQLSSSELIASALRLPVAEREHLVEVVQESLIDRSIDHGPEDAEDIVQAAWTKEIERRLASLDAGSVGTVPAEEAERMIRANDRPRL